MNLYHPRFHALAWLLSLLLLGGLGIHQFKRDWLETSFLALLPSTAENPAIVKAIERNNAAINRKLLFLVGATRSRDAIALAEQLKQRLDHSGLFRELILQQSLTAHQQNYQRLFQYRYQLLTASVRQQLENNPEQLKLDNLALLSSPFGQLDAMSLEQDPFLLFNRYFRSLNPLPLNLEQNVVVLQDGQRVWALLIGELHDQELKFDKLEALLTLVEESKKDMTTQGAELLATGIPLFTAQGAQSAQREMSLIGTGSTLGVMLLLVLAFRSPRPLVLSCLAVASGLFAAWVLSLQIFDKLHILTLVFGSSLIGVVVDYALHFFCDGIGLAHWTPRSGLRYVLPGIAFGLFTSLLGYAGLGFSPFPVLQEIAVFSAIGLTVSWLTVVCLFPYLLTGFQPRVQTATANLIRYWHQHWPNWLRRHHLAVYLALSLLIAGGLLQLTARDNVRLLQSAPGDLLAVDAKIKQLLPITRENQFFLVSGKDQNEWYANEQRLLIELEKLQRDGVFRRFEAISHDWPDPAAQAAHYQLLQTRLYRPDQLARTMTDLGFSVKAIANEQQQFALAEQRVLSLADWLAASDESKQRLWLGCEPSCQSMVALSGLTDTAALAKLALPGVVWVDQVQQLSDLFRHYRLNVTVLLVGVCCLILAILVARLGLRKGLRLLSTPVLAILLALATLGWLGELFTLFNVFALLLVLEMGVDYAIFFHIADGEADAESKRSSTGLAVTLSALTTLLSYGLLATSETAIIHAFGTTLTAGVLAAFLLAPL